VFFLFRHIRRDDFFNGSCPMQGLRPQQGSEAAGICFGGRVQTAITAMGALIEAGIGSFFVAFPDECARRNFPAARGTGCEVKRLNERLQVSFTPAGECQFCQRGLKDIPRWQFAKHFEGKGEQGVVYSCQHPVACLRCLDGGRWGRPEWIQYP
jgi:hypothetical protein